MSIHYLTPPTNVDQIPPSFAAHQNKVFLIKIDGEVLEDVLEFAKTISHDSRHGVQFMVPIPGVTDVDNYNAVKDNYEDEITISVGGLVPEILPITFEAKFKIQDGMVVSADTNVTYQLD